MSIETNDPKIERFYDALFEQASRIVRSGKTHAPIIVLMHSSGATRAMLTMDLSSDQRASLFMGLASDPEVIAAALIVEAWYAEGCDAASLAAALEMAQNGELSEYAGRKEAIVISVLTPSRQAVMICPIDRTTNSLQKAPFQWINEQAANAYLGRYVRSPDNTCH